MTRGEHRVVARGAVRRSSASAKTTGERVWTTSPAGRAVDGDRVPTTDGAVAPPTALTTSSSPSTSWIAHASAPSSDGAWSATSSRIAAGSSSVARRLPSAGELLGRARGRCARSRRARCARGRARAAPARRRPSSRSSSRERALLGEEDDDERRLARAAADRRGSQAATLTPASRRHSSPKRSSSSRDDAESRRRSLAAVTRTSAEARDLVVERRRELVGNAVRGGELEPPRARHQHRGEGSPERLVRRVGDRVEGGRLREVLGQRGGDPVEAALDPRLANALLEARRVADRERREAGERLEQARARARRSAAPGRGSRRRGRLAARPTRSSAPRSRSRTPA